MSTRLFAHRGRMPGFTDNTIEAFLECARLGADGVEIDVRRSADGALVVHHDPEIPGVGVVGDLAARDLPDWVPLLDAALDACEGMSVNVEIKNDPSEPGFDADGSLAQELCSALGGYEERVLVSCFHLPTVDAVWATNPEIPTAWLSVRLDDPARDLGRVATRGHSGVNLHHLGLTGDLIDEAHGLGLEVGVWTVDDPPRMKQLQELGVDLIITNTLELGLATLRGISA